MLDSAKIVALLMDCVRMQHVGFSVFRDGYLGSHLLAGERGGHRVGGCG